jgi:hypothetical protein
MKSKRKKTATPLKAHAASFKTQAKAKIRRVEAQLKIKIRRAIDAAVKELLS